MTQFQSTIHLGFFTTLRPKNSFTTQLWFSFTPRPRRPRYSWTSRLFVLFFKGNESLWSSERPKLKFWFRFRPKLKLKPGRNFGRNRNSCEKNFQHDVLEVIYWVKIFYLFFQKLVNYLEFSNWLIVMYRIFSHFQILFFRKISTFVILAGGFRI